MRSHLQSTLKKILSEDLDFHDASSTYASHAIHAFAAKFPPQLPRTFIESLTGPDDIVLDPMMGSGTTVLEAAISGRRAVGVDLDPLAVRLCAVKTTPIETRRLTRAINSVLDRAALYMFQRVTLHDEIHRRFDAASRKFLDYWFLPQTQEELTALLMSIEKETEPKIASFLRIVFSSVIITKSGGVSRARDLAHSRPHRVVSKKPRSAIEQFETQARKGIAALAELPPDLAAVQLYHADARNLPLRGSSVDLVITSPPYANAIDYMRAHKFSLVWFGERLRELSELRACYIGSENCGGHIQYELPPDSANDVTALAARDPGKARILEKYLTDMTRVLAEILRVLRP
ncbi:MAG: site-specific DNA-methyltransferase, partial [Deltaproteobacteria bacterium]|nr:site-specific DNA-methyltransferase [Deltaproteobacteria bacterium]